jgi:acetyl esterase
VTRTRSPSPRERVLGAVARKAAALPPRVQVALSGRPPVRVDGQQLDAGIQLMLAGAERTGAGSLARRAAGEDPEDARENSRSEAIAFAGRPTRVGAVRDLRVEGGAGSLAARHYVPAEPGAPHPLLVYLHGGGWTTGDLDTHDEPCRLLCRHAGVHVVAVDYRLAPEHKFPAAVEDAGAALRWAQAKAGRLGADPSRVAIGGDSAGANLAAVASREAEQPPALQLLIYPPMDLTGGTRSRELFAEGFFLTRERREWFDENYFGGTGADPADPRLSPLLAPDLTGLPPSIVATGAFDPLRDEGEAYAAALGAAGVPVALRRAPGLVHGFVNMTGINHAARDAVLGVAGMTRAALALRGPRRSP